jgi:hypothetical protein
VIVVVPAPTMVIVFPETVATAVSELVYVKTPVLFELGSINENDASPYVFVGKEKLVMVGVTIDIWVLFVNIVKLFVTVAGFVFVSPFT